MKETLVAVFGKLKIGDKFIEVMSTCDEVATKIDPTEQTGKLVNAQRIGGKLIFMADWEPVMTDFSYDHIDRLGMLRKDFAEAYKMCDWKKEFMIRALIGDLTPIGWHNGTVVALPSRPRFARIMNTRKDRILRALSAVNPEIKNIVVVEGENET